MKSLVGYMSSLDAGKRRGLIMLLDVAMVLLAVPFALLLSSSHLSFDAFSPLGFAIWAGIGLVSHLLFRFGGLYNTVWRFASTPDFFNIIKSCAVLVIFLYLITLGVRLVMPVTGLNERQFVALFLVAFTIISAPRLTYRYLREGAGWGIGRSTRKARRRAVFVGNLGQADAIIRFMRSGSMQDMNVVGIMAVDEEAESGSRIQGVPVLATGPRLAGVLDEYVKGAESIDALIFEEGAERRLEEFSELVRVARRSGISVQQFSSLSRPDSGGDLVLETVEMETILRRETVPSDLERIGGYIKGKRVLVTGGAGSIGRTLVKRALELDASGVLVADISEFAIFRLTDDISPLHHDRLSRRVVDVTDRQLFSRVVREFAPDIIFHAAALKHVPLLEENWVSAIKTNVFGTLTCAEVAAACGVPQFVLISSDKAADPTSVLGLTKRLAEQIVNALHVAKSSAAAHGDRKTVFTAVRFGNVFGSDGSVATIFERQIRVGGPVTITDRDMTRYMMTIGEAVDLVIMAASDSGPNRMGGDYGIYMLDMGEPVSILTVAETMIRLAGKKPHEDIAIEFTGIRPGEKIHETLSAAGERIVDIDVPNIFGLRSGVFELEEIRSALSALRRAISQNRKHKAVTTMKNLHRDSSDRDAEKNLSIAV